MPTGIILPASSGAMFGGGSETARRRLLGGLLAAGLQAALALILWYGLAAPGLPTDVQSALTSLDLRAPPPPPPPVPAPHHPSRRAGAAALPAPHAQAAPVVAPRVLPLDPPPVIPVAAVAGQGVQPGAGAATAGNGSGAAGQGDGTGAGGTGDGDGDGPLEVNGQFKSSDTPPDLRDAPFSGIARVLVTVDAAGKVTDCRTQRSSGNAELDAVTCRIIGSRFRFRPARDAAGRAVAGKFIYEQDWEVGGGFDTCGAGDLRCGETKH